MLLLLQLSQAHALSPSSWASDAVARAASLRTELALPSLHAQTLCDRPSILHVRGLFSDAECDAIVEQSRGSGLMRASRVGTADGTGYEENSAIRSSQECVLAPDGVLALPDDALPVCAARRLHRLLGDVAHPDHVEGPKVVQYRGTGQHYSEHYDWSPQLAASAAGQRTTTALVYLSTVGADEGGCTFFPRVGLRVPPERGSVLVWSNLDDEGEPDRETLHGSEPILVGAGVPSEKWVVNFFYRRRSFFELAVASLEERQAAESGSGGSRQRGTEPGKRTARKE
tara:strand:- start:5 stop:859 length:855 start_codon:yes stop_codon:yes gene_type:complete